MKAIVYHNYGSPDVLQLEEIDKPTAGDDEVLIKVQAASVNPLDCGELKGVPFLFRMLFGLKKPTAARPWRPGVDVAGVVEAVGSKITRFQPGDGVFGVCISDPQVKSTRARKSNNHTGLAWRPTAAGLRYLRNGRFEDKTINSETVSRGLGHAT